MKSRGPPPEPIELTMRCAARKPFTAPLPMMRWVAFILLLVATAHAETPKLSLKCTPTSAGLPVAHTVVIYSMTATVDGVPFVLETREEGYTLKAPAKTAADLLEPPSQIAIDRVTGEYAIFGREILRPELGVCEKVVQKF